MNAPLAQQLELCGHVDRVFALLGKRWTGLLIDLLLQRPARFSELARVVPALSDRVLGDRLRELEAAGLVKREVEHGPPIAVTYRLTPAGEALRPAMEALRSWAQERAESQSDAARPVERCALKPSPTTSSRACCPRRARPGEAVELAGANAL